MKPNRKHWRICVALVGIIVLLGYTPLLIPKGIYNPMLFGIPYTLWLGILVTVILVVLTYIGSRVHPGTDQNEEGA
jgi:protein-S-isoprenylcysteine O-methyltransferase Ste14